MRLGIDFDNTIVCYDAVFLSEALRRQLVPADLPPTKTAVRNYLRQNGREADWTALQGLVYGPEIGQATPFPGVHDCLRMIQRRGIAVCVISHKTRYPVLGPRCDLHEAARKWLAQAQLLDETIFDDQFVDDELPDKPGGGQSADRGVALRPDCVFFEETKEAKLRRIADMNCTHFVDDLPEFLTEPDFPAGVKRILFDPHRTASAPAEIESAHHWDDIADMIQE